MTSTLKTNTTPDVSGIVDGQQADASDVTTPISQLATAVDLARSKLSVTANDTHIKELDDAITVSTGITKSVVNPSGDEQLQLMIDTAIVATLSNAVSLSNKTLITPTIASMINAAHNHEDAVGGGTLNASLVFGGGTVPVARLPAFVGTNGATPGTAGLVPAPLAADFGKLLGADGTWKTVAGSGTVTSVALSMPAQFSVSGSPVTAAGTLAAAWANQSGNTVLSSPSGGGSGAPTFRALVAADIPTLTNSKISDRALTEFSAFATVGPVASISITSIPSSWDHLLLILGLRTDLAATAAAILVRMNNDATIGNYYSSPSVITNSGINTSDYLGTQAGIRINSGTVAASSPANLFSFVMVWIYNYKNTARTVVKFDGYNPGTSSGNLSTLIGGGHYVAAAAITRIDIIPVNASDFVAGSGYALYGVG